MEKGVNKSDVLRPGDEFLKGLGLLKADGRFTLVCDVRLKEKFKEVCYMRKDTPTEVLNKMMQAYVGMYMRAEE